MAAVGLVAALALGAWQWVQVTGDIRVYSDGEPWRCVGTEVTSWTDPVAASEFRIPVVPASPGLDCDLRFYIQNESNSGVVLEQVRFAVLGPDAGFPAVATRLDSVVGTLTDGPVPTEIDAIWAVGESLEPGVVYPHDVKLAFRPDGCLSEGAVSWAAWPTVQVRWFGLTKTIEPDTTQVGVIGTAESSCDG